MKRDQETTGQIFVRDMTWAQEGTPDESNRRLLALCGILAVPINCPLQSEHQYAVIGTKECRILSILPGGQDLTEQSRGQTFTNLLCSRIWRI